MTLFFFFAEVRGFDSGSGLPVPAWPLKSGTVVERWARPQLWNPLGGCFFFPPGGCELFSGETDSQYTRTTHPTLFPWTEVKKKKKKHLFSCRWATLSTFATAVILSLATCQSEFCAQENGDFSSDRRDRICPSSQVRRGRVLLSLRTVGTPLGYFSFSFTGLICAAAACVQDVTTFSTSTFLQNRSSLCTLKGSRLSLWPWSYQYLYFGHLSGLTRDPGTHHEQKYIYCST